MQTAIQAIYRDMEYAKSLIEKKAGKNAAAARHAATSGSEDIEDDDEEESWTFVTGEEDDSEVDTMLRKSTILAPGANSRTLGTRATLTSTPKDILWTTAGTAIAEPGPLTPLERDPSNASAGGLGPSSSAEKRASRER